jgi:hypothetical protein
MVSTDLDLTLTPVDFFFWHTIKDKMYMRKSMSMNHLWHYSEEEFHNPNEDIALCKNVMDSVKDFNCV